MLNEQKGSMLVEVIVGAAILSMVSLAFFGALSLLSRFHQKDMLSLKGSLLAEEGIEAVRFIKDTGWTAISSLSSEQDYYFELKSSSWSATTTAEVVDGMFFRSFRLLPVRRDSLDTIVASGGSLDPFTRLVQVSVAWNWHGATTTVGYQAYITAL